MQRCLFWIHVYLSIQSTRCWGSKVGPAAGDLPNLASETLESGLTTVRFKTDIIKLFRSSRYAQSTALDIGAGAGTTTAALALNFGVVVAIEKYWELAKVLTGDGYHLSSKLRTKDGGRLSNIVRMHMDTGLPYSFSALSEQNVSAVVIDAEHKFSSIARETFHVLRDIPCCVETIMYHDYCDDEVNSAVQWFVDGGLLTFRTALGERNFSFWWCQNGKPEGAAMRVLRNRPDFHARVERLSRLLFGRGGAVRQALNGSEWMLTSGARAATVAVLTLGFWPRSCYIRPVTRLSPGLGRGLKQSPHRDGGLTGLTYRLGPASVLQADVPLLSITTPGRRLGASMASMLWLELDRELNLLRLHVSEGHPLQEHLGPSAMGINLRWSLVWGRHLDNLLYVDEAIAAATLGKGPRFESKAALRGVMTFDQSS